MSNKQVIYRKGVKPIASSGTVTLDSGASGSVDSITVNGVEVMSGPVPFLTSLTVTAANVAANINAFASNPEYTASSAGAVIKISPVILGASTNGFVVASTATTIATTDVNLAGGTINTTGAKAQNVEWFSTDISPNIPSDVVADLEVGMSLQTSVLVQVSFDGGTTWASLVTPAAVTFTKVLIPVISTDLVQLRTNDAAGVTIDRCLVGLKGD